MVADSGVEVDDRVALQDDLLSLLKVGWVVVRLGGGEAY